MPVIFIQIHIGIRVDKGIIDVKTKMIGDVQQDIQSRHNRVVLPLFRKVRRYLRYCHTMALS